MLPFEDLERLIARKKRDIQEEKVLLGLVPLSSYATVREKDNGTAPKKEVRIKEPENTAEVEHNVVAEKETQLYDLEESIPPDLERYIRRYAGLPVMLKAGEFSPNNPLLRGDRVSGVCGDALLGLGEYERRRNTLRKIRQAQYREFLDRQATKKQEAKEEAERERREQEQKEREREERERQLLLERDRYSPERRASVSCVPLPQYASGLNNKVDTAVQVDAVSTPLSVAVQTDDAHLYRLPSSPGLTEAERELSPRTVAPPPPRLARDERRRSYTDYDERTSSIRQSKPDKLHSQLRHSYMPSIFDSDAIHMRNLQVEKDAAERRQCYQQELRNQIMEQQRIREERKSREKLLEQAEMRRLEEQLRMLRAAQETERSMQRGITAAIKDNARDYETKRAHLQRDIDAETQKLRAVSHPSRHLPTRPINSSRSDTQKLPNFNYYQNEKSFQPIDKKPYSFNIPDNSLFSPNYDVDSYLRKNLNFKNKGVEFEKGDDFNRKGSGLTKISTAETTRTAEVNFKNKGVEFDRGDDFNRKESGLTKNSTAETTRTAEVKEHRDDRRYAAEKVFVIEKERQIDRPATLVYDVDSLSVPVLRHSPKKQTETADSNSLSDAMKKVDDKWKVPVVQKNILKSLPNEGGGNISILTQLGSIRRQLQLEQLKLDKMMNKV